MRTPSNGNRMSSSDIDLSQNYSTRNKIYADKEPASVDLKELRSRLDALQKIPRGPNDPKFNETFWNALLDIVAPLEHKTYYSSEEPSSYSLFREVLVSDEEKKRDDNNNGDENDNDNEYQIRSMQDIQEYGKKVRAGLDLSLPLKPAHVAQQTGVPLDHVLVELMYATMVGLVEMMWTTECQTCGGPSKLLTSLSSMQKDNVCTVCERPITAERIDDMKVLFAFDSSIFYFPTKQSVICPHHAAAPRMNYLRAYLMVPPTTLDTKWSYLFGIKDHPKSQPALEAGRYRIHCFYSGVDADLIVQRNAKTTDDAEEEDEPLRIFLRTSDMTRPQSVVEKRKTYTIEHGKVRIDFLNDQDCVSAFWVYKDIPDDNYTMFYLPEEGREPFASATDLIHLPCFKTLFGDQVIGQSSNFSVRKVFLVFTDVVSSTDLYESSGDGQALQLVQDHFKVIFSAFEESGRIVKTIGDAVMGAFTSGEKALQAVAKALDGMIENNLMRPDGTPFQVRIGMHAGPALVVPLNGINDYFGRTVNVAARVESKAVGGECLISDSVLSDSSSKAAFEKLLAEGYARTREEVVSLKGVPNPVTVFGFQSKHA